MNMFKKVLPMTLAVGLLAGAAMAAVNGSHHDLSTWTAGGTEEVCLFCHGVTQTATATTEYGEIGDLCVNRCHQGASGFVGTAAPVPNRPASLDEAGAVVAQVPTLDAINTTNGFAHGLNRADLYDVYGAAGNLAFDPIGDAFPYTAVGTSMECTSCHNVHDNTNTPFLQADLFTGGPGGESFCEACHTARGNSWVGGEAAPNGDHPVNVTLVLGDAARSNAERLGRYIAIDVATGGQNVFDVTTDTTLGSSAQNYTTGGKVSSWTTAGAGDTFGCYTCHSPHMDNNGALTTPNLVLREIVSADGQWNPLCVSCHGDVANGLDDPNPGLQASLYYHPVGTGANTATAIDAVNNIFTYQTSTNSFEFSVDLDAVATVGNQGAMADGASGVDLTTGKPRCTSCHDVHGGITGTMALLDLDGTRDGSFTGQICQACHNGVGLPDVADNPGQAGEAKSVVVGTQGSHHRTRTSTYGTATIADADGEDLNMDTPSWGADTARLGCDDCHVFSGDNHFTAHNW